MHHAANVDTVVSHCIVGLLHFVLNICARSTCSPCAQNDISLNRSKEDGRISWLFKIAESIISSTKANIIDSAVHFTRPILFLLNSDNFL